MDGIPGGAEASLVERDLAYLPLPNRVEVVLDGRLAPAGLTRTAFVLAFLEGGEVVMAANRRRGPEIPGGHIDPGESAGEAAARELLEETGARVEGPMRSIGYLRMVSGGTVPEGWDYPHPVGYQQFFAARAERGFSPSGYRENDECLAPMLVAPRDAMSEDGPLTPGQRAFHRAAFAAVFGRDAADARDAEPPAPR